MSASGGVGTKAASLLPENPAPRSGETPKPTVESGGSVQKKGYGQDWGYVVRCGDCLLTFGAGVAVYQHFRDAQDQAWKIPGAYVISYARACREEQERRP